MTDYRPLHKTQLQTVLQTITFEGFAISCSTSYITSGQNDPYIFIGDGQIRANIQGGKMMDNSTYLRGYEYFIIMAFRPTLNSEGMQDSLQDARISTLEALVLDKLQSDPVRSNSTWKDLTVSGVSETYSPDPSLTDNLIYKMLTVEIEQEISLYTL